jgi:hypothetical protein
VLTFKGYEIIEAETREEALGRLRAEVGHPRDSRYGDFLPAVEELLERHKR